MTDPDNEAGPEVDAGGTGDNRGNDGESTMAAGDAPVGYRRPPRQHQFKPGQSGNPRGRPKGAPGLRTIFEAELGQRVRGTHNGKVVSFSKLQVVVKRMVDKAMSGDQRAIEQLITLNITMFGLGAEDQVDDAPLTEGEIAFLNAATNRLPAGDAAAGLIGDPDALCDEEDTNDAD
jgi:hypothetical protein